MRLPSSRSTSSAARSPPAHAAPPSDPESHLETLYGEKFVAGKVRAQQEIDRRSKAAIGEARSARTPKPMLEVMARLQRAARDQVFNAWNGVPVPFARLSVQVPRQRRIFGHTFALRPSVSFDQATVLAHLTAGKPVEARLFRTHLFSADTDPAWATGSRGTPVQLHSLEDLAKWWRGTAIPHLEQQS